MKHAGVAITITSVTYVDLQSGVAYHSLGFEDENLGSSPDLLGQ